MQIQLHGVSLSASFPSKGMARSWATEREAEIIAGARGLVVRGKSIAAMFKRYAEEVAPTHKGERWEKIRLDLLLREWGIPGKAVDSVSPNDVAGLRDKRLRSVGKSTVRRELVLLGAVFEVARREWRWCASNPVRDVKKPPGAQPRTRLILPTEYRLMLRALGYRPGQIPKNKTQYVGCAWCLAIRTGMRAGEILGLTWDRVDLERRVATLPETKNGTQREVPLFPRALKILKPLARDNDAVGGEVNDHERIFEALSSSTLDALYRKARAAAGVVGLHWHDSRHTACTLFARDGRLSALQLARVLGHHDLKMTLLYFNESASSIAASAKNRQANSP